MDAISRYVWRLGGASINGGWINYDKTSAAADYLFNLFKDDIEEGLFYKNENEIWEEN